MLTVMNLRHTFLLSALVAAPLLTETATARTLVQLYKDLAAAPHAVDADAARRAGTFPALAVMPADAEACFAITDINGKSLPLLTIEPGKGLDNPKVKEHIEAFGLAVGKGNAADFAAFMPMYQYLAGREDYPARALAWTENARAEYSEIINGQVDTNARTAALEAVRKVKGMHLHPVYVAVTADVPAHRYLMDVADDYIDHYAKKYSGSRVTENGCKGVKIPFKSLFDLPEGDASVESTLRDEIRSRSLYMMFKQQGGTLIAIACEDPKEINTATSADKSILSTAALQSYDPYLLSGIVTAGYVSADLINTANSYQEYDLKEYASFVQDVFRGMGEEDDANVVAYNSAAAAVKPVLNYVSSYVRTDADKPFTFCVWPQDDGMHAKVTFDAYDSTFKPGYIRLARIARNDKVLFYAESTEETTTNPRKTIDVVEPVLNLAVGYSTAMDSAKTDTLGHKLIPYMPRMKAFMRNVRAADKALGDEPAFIVMPLKSGEMAVSYFNSIKDRAALGKAGEGIVSALSRMIDGKANTFSKKLKVKAGKNVASYTGDMSDFAPDVELNATFSDKAKTFAFGNSAALNAQMIKFGTGKINFTGAVYTIRPAALTIATKAAPEAAMINPFLEGVGAVHATNTIKDDVRTIHVLLSAPGQDADEE